MITPSKKSLHVALKAAWRRSGLTAAELAEALGAERVGHVERWLSGEICPATINFIALCDAIGAPVEEVVQAARDEEENRRRRAGRKVRI